MDITPELLEVLWRAILWKVVAAIGVGVAFGAPIIALTLRLASNVSSQGQGGRDGD